jgi:hypothetical protein
MESQTVTITTPVLDALGYFQIEEETLPSSCWAILMVKKPFANLDCKRMDRRKGKRFQFPGKALVNPVSLE